MSTQAEPRNPCIAVVAVHGVANQQPRQTARTIANLLIDYRQDEAKPRQYTSFTEQNLRIDRRPLWPVFRRGKTKKSLVNFNERAAQANEPPSADPEKIGHEFMVGQLEYYESDSETPVYDTVRLDGHRICDGKPVADVHIFEVYWADLSRLGTGIVRFFGELYQLLLHLPSLGRHVVDYAAKRQPDTSLWRTYKFCQVMTNRLITLPIPILNLLGIALLIPLAAPIISSNREAVAAIIGIAAGFALSGFLLRRGAAVSQLVWIASLITIPVAAGMINYRIAQFSARPEKLLAAELWLLAAGACLALLAVYNTRRPGALATGIVLGLLVTGTFFVFLVHPWELTRGDIIDPVAVSTLHTFEIINVLLQLSWFLLIVFLMTTAVLGRRAWRRIPAGPERERVKRAAWTARLTTAFPAALFAILTVVIWKTILGSVATLNLVPEKTPFEPLPITAAYLDDHHLREVFGDRLDEIGGVAAALLENATLQGFVILLGAVGLFMLATLWAAFPSVLTELKPPKESEDQTPSRALGTWLTTGLKSVRFIGDLLTWAFPLSLIVVVAMSRGLHIHWLRSGTTIAVTGAGLLLLLGLKGWIPGADSILDIMLDVDNYMREHPRDRAPRARIMERYASLLRHICTWESDGQKYDGVVIIAHSQGTVITADFLRFLRLEKEVAKQAGKKWEPELERFFQGSLPARFFSMGSPLRQLYALCFPHHYSWIGEPRSGELPHIGDEARPLTDTLGVEEWVNAYRSGDYVGREIWRDDADDEIWLRRRKDSKEAPSVYRDRAERRRQFCIGAGAHTRYWDETARDIAAELSRLVDKVADSVMASADLSRGVAKVALKERST